MSTVINDNFTEDHGNFDIYTLGGATAEYVGGRLVFDKTDPSTITQWQKDGLKLKKPRWSQIGDVWQWSFSFDTYTPGSSWWQIGLTASSDPGLPNSLNGLFMNGNEFAVNGGSGIVSVPTPPIGIKTKRLYTFTMVLESDGNMPMYLKGPGFNFQYTSFVGGPMQNRDLWAGFQVNSREKFNLHGFKLDSNFGV